MIHFKKDGTIGFDDAAPYLGKGNFAAQTMLHAKYGKKVTIGLCGPVGEYQGLLAGISFSDKDGRPRGCRRAAAWRGHGRQEGKAIVVDLDKIPPFTEAKKVNAAIKDYAKMLQADSMVTNFYAKIGTMGMADMQNSLGGLPVRNFSAGQMVDVASGEKFKMGGEYISQLNVSRGGDHTHACMPGCVIQCSNVYVDASGKEVVSPVEYETLGLLGTNCGLGDPDDLAQMNYIANDLGVDTIETGAMLAVLMEAGLGAFGDVKFMADCLAEIGRGTEKGRLWAQGTARVGEHYKVRRVPVIKKQAISAYDPRVVEATGITMMATAQGVDHTAGNLPRLKTREMEAPAIVEQSLAHQARVAANDSLGLCIFGMSVTNPNTEFLANAINAATARASPRTSSSRWAARRCGWNGSSTSSRASRKRTTSSRRSSTRKRCRPPTTSRASTPPTSTGCTSSCPPGADRGSGPAPAGLLLSPRGRHPVRRLWRSLRWDGLRSARAWNGSRSRSGAVTAPTRRSRPTRATSWPSWCSSSAARPASPGDPTPWSSTSG